jgi:hypothetical protein
MEDGEGSGAIECLGVRRRLFNFAAAVSLVICVASIALLARSFWIADTLIRTHFDPRYDEMVTRRFDSECGRLTYDGMTDPIAGWPVSDGTRALFAAEDGWTYKTDRSHNRLRLRDSLLSVTWWNRVKLMAGTERYIDVPAWPITLLTTVLPVLFVLRYRLAARRRKIGRCPTCGYDLRASPDRCPECGTAVTPPVRGSAAARAAQSRATSTASAIRRTSPPTPAPSRLS